VCSVVPEVTVTYAALDVAHVRDERLLGDTRRGVDFLGVVTDRGSRDRGRRGERRCSGGRAGDLHERAPAKAFHISAPSRRLVPPWYCGRR